MKGYLVAACIACSVVAGAQTYVDLGDGLMTDAMITEWYQMAPVTYTVKVQKEEGAEKYRVLAPYGQTFADALLATNGVQLKDEEFDKAGVCVLNIDATDPEDVYFAKTMTGCNWGSGEMYIGIPTTGKVTLKDGIFSSSPRGVAVGDDSGAVAMNMTNKFRIVLPGVTATDYDLELTAASHCLTNGRFAGHLLAGNDVAKVYYGIFSDFQEDEILSAYGEVMTCRYEFTARGDFEYVTTPDSRKETLVLVGVDAQDNEVSYAWTTYYDVSDDADNWRPIGYGDFTDPFLPALTTCSSHTMNVALEEHKEIPGYMRMRNPYATSPYATERYFHGGEPDHDHFIYINGTDMECIYVEESPICFDFGHGLCRVSSFVQYFLQAGYDLDECKELELGGYIDEDTHTLRFPEEALTFSMLGYDNGDWYITEPDKGDFALTLPEGYNFAGVADVAVENDKSAVPEYYDLHGVKVDGKRLLPGLYIERKGTHVQKIRVL